MGEGGGRRKPEAPPRPPRENCRDEGGLPQLRPLNHRDCGNRLLIVLTSRRREGGGDGDRAQGLVE
eukprot:6090623-Prorocentrum_lima.AAC.1